MAPGPGQVLSDGGHQAPGHLRPRGGAGRGQEAHAGHYRELGVQWLDALKYFQELRLDASMVILFLVKIR